jgi:hypothetical protein
MLHGRGRMGAVPRNRLIRRQVALTLATLLACLLPWSATGMLAGSGSPLTAATAALPVLIGAPAPIMLWFTGEDDLDITTTWITPVTVATLLLAVAATIGAPTAYLTTVTDRTPVTVTAVDGPHITTTPHQPTHVPAGHDIHPGDQLEIIHDPLGWFPPTATTPPPHRQRLAWLAGLTGLTLLAVVTALRVRRDLLRYDLTGSRRPPQRVRDARERRRHEREQRIERLRARRRGTAVDNRHP